MATGDVRTYNRGKRDSLFHAFLFPSHQRALVRELREDLVRMRIPFLMRADGSKRANVALTGLTGLVGAAWEEVWREAGERRPLAPGELTLHNLDGAKVRCPLTLDVPGPGVVMTLGESLEWRREVRATPIDLVDSGACLLHWGNERITVLRLVGGRGEGIGIPPGSALLLCVQARGTEGG